ncbi:laminin G sub domain 2 [Seminavis robusta]|uniref:Laminin G sub domain 2 n=1 Tax=Seminavis robusta TaxID=568900 RepID=A0A9N8EVK2_9STRA|nr:laminin G sub domain 2 [Seminavis robusta]|eukprot:Sro1737_g294490.1 laminin G sub domain 2 (926) ;mRNA; f:18657-21528
MAMVQQGIAPISPPTDISHQDQGKEQDNLPMRQLQQEDCENSSRRHCVYPEELDVYSQPVATGVPSVEPSRVPTKAPTEIPTGAPTVTPSATPSVKPTVTPTTKPTGAPTAAPTAKPTGAPTVAPTMFTTADANAKPPASDPQANPTPDTTTEAPTSIPTKIPTAEPTRDPTKLPTKSPSQAPTPTPTKQPTNEPSKAPSANPTDRNTNEPTKIPTDNPTENTSEPTKNPSAIPTKNPSATPTNLPSAVPTKSPSVKPTTMTPTNSVPTLRPSEKPVTEESISAPSVPQSTRSPRPNEASYEFTLSLVPTGTEEGTTAAGSTPIPTKNPTSHPTKDSINQDVTKTTPTITPTFATKQPHQTSMPTVKPTLGTIDKTTPSPTSKRPTLRPSNPPTVRPTSHPIPRPTIVPTEVPSTTGAGTDVPTLVSSTTGTSTGIPTRNPTYSATGNPTSADSEESVNGVPTVAPTGSESTQEPTGTGATASPTLVPTRKTLRPTQVSTSNADPMPNQFAPPTPGPDATTNPTATATTTTTVQPSSSSPGASGSAQCESDSEGNFGLTIPLYSDAETSTGSNVHLVEYRYQVETTPKFEITEDDLNSGILRSMEKAISDLLVTSFFPASAGFLCNKEASTTGNMSSAAEVSLSKAAHFHRVLVGGGDTATQWGNKTSNVVVGLAADPPDLVAAGIEGVSCPFPLHIAISEEDLGVPACYVIDGELSIFMGGNIESAGDLSWVDNMVQQELEFAMNTGELDDVDPAISFVRYIPSETGLNDTDTGSGTSPGDVVFIEEEPVDVTLSSTPSWSWIIAGFGFVGIALVLVFITVYQRRQNIEGNDFESTRNSHRGAFPVVEIVDENSEFDNDEIYKDDEEDENSILETHQPASWRQVTNRSQTSEEYSHLEINSTDPNQPVVKPVLDEEAETFINNV